MTLRGRARTRSWPKQVQYESLANGEVWRRGVKLSYIDGESRGGGGAWRAYFVLLLDISVKPQPASTMLITICRYHTQGVKEVPSSLAHWRKKIGVETTCVEIKFQAPHAIDAMLSR